MRCAAIKKQLSRYHDAELAPDARAEVATHLAGCPRCRATLAELETVAGQWAGFARAPVPENFSDQVMRTVQRQHTRSERRVSPRRIFLEWWREQTLAMRALAASVVVIAGAIGLALGGDFIARPAAKNTSAHIGAALGARARVEILSGTPEGSLAQTYLAWTRSAEPSQK